MASTSEIRRAKDRAIGGKKDRCRKGKSCSATCISGWKACLVEMPSSISSSLKRMHKLVEKGVQQAVPKLREKHLVDRKLKYLDLRDKLAFQIERAILSRNQQRTEALKERFRKMEDTVGKRLKLRRGLEPYEGLVFLKYRLIKSDLVKDGPKDISVKYGGNNARHAILIKSTVMKVPLEITVSPNSFAFKVNNSYEASDNLSRAQKMAIIREVDRQFKEVIKKLPDGLEVEVTPYEGNDNRKNMRVRAYRNTGFSDEDDVYGSMYGKVSKGRIVPSTRDTYENNYVDKFPS